MYNQICGVRLGNVKVWQLINQNFFLTTQQPKSNKSKYTYPYYLPLLEIKTKVDKAAKSDAKGVVQGCRLRSASLS